MTEEEKYRSNAIAALELAEDSQSVEAKFRLLELVDAWLDLADCARRGEARQAV